jgi:endoglucanase
VPVGDQSGHLSDLKLTEIDAGGMVFHKIADTKWTGVPLPPHDDTQPRFLSYTSTAATLNLAATAAQCARIWRPLNATYADKCLAAAEKAWQAANMHKNVYAYDNFDGSGPYGDTNVANEFYWAAAELFVTTGKDEYKTALEQSPYYLTSPTKSDDLTWSNMGSAGTVSLALVPNHLDQSTINEARSNLLKAADVYEASVKKQGYLIPYQSDQYPWGSNSSLMNRSIFLWLAFDWTKTQKYLQAMSDSMDYILGRNPMDHPYVSGYGSYPLLNPHHRF